MKTLAQLEQDAQDLAAQIKLLKEKEEQAAAGPWDPAKHAGCYYISAASNIFKDGGALERLNGRTFQTREDAEKASKFFTFYQRLYQLALECNAKHKELRHQYILFSGSHWQRESCSNGYYDPSSFFTSYAAAQEACDIMNRDKWIMPTM